MNGVWVGGGGGGHGGIGSGKGGGDTAGLTSEGWNGGHNLLLYEVRNGDPSGEKEISLVGETSDGELHGWTRTGPG